MHAAPRDLILTLAGSHRRQLDAASEARQAKSQSLAGRGRAADRVSIDGEFFFPSDAALREEWAAARTWKLATFDTRWTLGLLEWPLVPPPPTEAARAAEAAHAKAAAAAAADAGVDVTNDPALLTEYMRLKARTKGLAPPPCPRELRPPKPPRPHGPHCARLMAAIRSRCARDAAYGLPSATPLPTGPRAWCCDKHFKKIAAEWKGFAVDEVRDAEAALQVRVLLPLSHYHSPTATAYCCYAP